MPFFLKLKISKITIFSKASHKSRDGFKLFSAPIENWMLVAQLLVQNTTKKSFYSINLFVSLSHEHKTKPNPLSTS